MMTTIDLKAIAVTRNVVRLLRLSKTISAETTTEMLEALSSVEFADGEEIVGKIELESDDALLLTYNGRINWIPKSVMTITQQEDTMIKFKLTEMFRKLKGAV